LLGYVPAGYPLPNEEEALGKIKIPKDQLGAARDAKHLYAWLFRAILLLEMKFIRAST